MAPVGLPVLNSDIADAPVGEFVSSFIALSQSRFTMF